MSPLCNKHHHLISSSHQVHNVTALGSNCCALQLLIRLVWGWLASLNTVEHACQRTSSSCLVLFFTDKFVRPCLYVLAVSPVYCQRPRSLRVTLRTILSVAPVPVPPYPVSKQEPAHGARSPRITKHRSLVSVCRLLVLSVQEDTLSQV